MTVDRASLAQWGDSLAADYLRDHGLEILDRNYRAPHDELDLIGRQGSTPVFIEVKTRRSNRFGWPEQSISKKKIKHIIAAAEEYLLSHSGLGYEWRIDVIAIQLEQKTHKVSLRHYEHAVR